MFIATKPPRIQPSSVGAACFGWRWAYWRAFVTKKHAAPTELGQAIGEAVPIHMALLTELFALPTPSHADVKDPCKVCKVHSLAVLLSF